MSRDDRDWFTEYIQIWLLQQESSCPVSFLSTGYNYTTIHFFAFENDLINLPAIFCQPGNSIMRRRRPLSVKPTNTKRKLESLDPNFQSSVEERLKNLQCVLNIVDSNSNTSNENQLVAPNSRKRRKLNNDNESAQRFCKLLNDADAEFDFTHENKIEKNDKENEDDELQIIFPKENATKPQKYSAMKTISTNYVKQNLKRRFRRFRTRRPRRKKIEPVDIQPSVETAEEEKQNLSEEELEVIEQMSSGGREIKIQYGSPEEVANDDEKLSTILKKYFNHESFRPGQKEVIKRILLGKSTLAILPTGNL